MLSIPPSSSSFCLRSLSDFQCFVCARLVENPILLLLKKILMYMCGFPPQILPIMAPGYGNTSWYFRKEEKFLS